MEKGRKTDSHSDLCPASKGLQKFSHLALEGGEDLISGAMAGVDVGMGIVVLQAMGEEVEFFFRLVVVQTMKASYGHVHFPRTGGEDILDTAMCAPREEHTFGIEDQLVAEVVGYVVAVRILYEQVAVGLWQRKALWDVGKDMQVAIQGTRFVDEDGSRPKCLRPGGRDAVQSFSAREIPPSDGILRDDDSRPMVDVQEVGESSCMVAMPVREKQIVNVLQVNAQGLGIAQKNVTRSCVQQDAVTFGFQ